jgi:FtsP/CotA-like multicopper oxidase with cupredoxin domain
VEYEAQRRRISIQFSDRRKVGNLMLPHMIVTMLDGQPLEAIKIDEITLNPALTPKDFGG